MALVIRIPDSAFLAGGPFENDEPTKTQIVIGVRTEKQAVMAVTNSPQVIDAWNFKPATSMDMNEILNYIDRGMLEITDTTDSASPVMTSAEVLTLYRVYWQEF